MSIVEKHLHNLMLSGSTFAFTQVRSHLFVMYAVKVSPSKATYKFIKGNTQEKLLLNVAYVGLEKENLSN